VNSGETLHCSHATCIVKSELIHSPLFTCRTIEQSKEEEKKKKKKKKKEER
jgi:hypothetical protein